MSDTATELIENNVLILLMKREYFAAMVMQGILSSRTSSISVDIADALIKEIERTKG